MPSSYPGALDELTDGVGASGDPLSSGHVTHHTSVGEAVEAVQAELGVDPAGAEATVVARLDALAARLPINTQTGTTYTLVLADAGKIVTLNNASAVTLTVPPNSSVAFPTGTVINLIQLGAGQVTVAEGSGVTVNQPASQTLALAEQHAQAALTYLGADVWELGGLLEGA